MEPTSEQRATSSRRLFFALALPDRLLRSLAAWQAQARAAGLHAATPRPEGLHLTLVFLGEVPPALVAAAQPAGALEAARHGALALRTAGLGRFPERGAARVLWLGLEPSPPLLALQAGLDARLRTAGFDLERRAYAPHLTLARPKREPPPLPEAPEPFEWSARELALYESKAAPGGHRYQVVSAWPLGG